MNKLQYYTKKMIQDAKDNVTLLRPHSLIQSKKAAELFYQHLVAKKSAVLRYMNAYENNSCTMLWAFYKQTKQDYKNLVYELKGMPILKESTANKDENHLTPYERHLVKAMVTKNKFELKLPFSDHYKKSQAKKIQNKLAVYSIGVYKKMDEAELKKQQKNNKTNYPAL